MSGRTIKVLISEELQKELKEVIAKKKIVKEDLEAICKNYGKTKKEISYLLKTLRQREEARLLYAIQKNEKLKK